MTKALYLLVAGALVLAAASAVQAAISGQLTVYRSDGSVVDMTLKYSGSAPDVLADLTYSYHAGAWDRGQFKNPTADASHGFGWADNGVDQLKVAYTFYGDSTMDGIVNNLDLGDVLANYNKTGMTWSQGDYNYDGTVNNLDLGSILANASAALSTSGKSTRSGGWGSCRLVSMVACPLPPTERMSTSKSPAKSTMSAGILLSNGGITATRQRFNPTPQCLNLPRSSSGRCWLREAGWG